MSTNEPCPMRANLPDWVTVETLLLIKKHDEMIYFDERSKYPRATQNALESLLNDIDTNHPTNK